MYICRYKARLNFYCVHYSTGSDFWPPNLDRMLVWACIQTTVVEHKSQEQSIMSEHHGLLQLIFFSFLPLDFWRALAHRAVAKNISLVHSTMVGNMMLISNHWQSPSWPFCWRWHTAGTFFPNALKCYLFWFWVMRFCIKHYNKLVKRAEIKHHVGHLVKWIGNECPFYTRLIIFRFLTFTRSGLAEKATEKNNMDGYIE